MARAGGMRHWAALKRTLVVPLNPNLKPLAKPTDEMLDRYKATVAGSCEYFMLQVRSMPCPTKAAMPATGRGM